MADTGDAAVEAGQAAHHTAREVTNDPPQETTETHTEVTVTGEDITTGK